MLYDNNGRGPSPMPQQPAYQQQMQRPSPFAPMNPVDRVRSMQSSQGGQGQPGPQYPRFQRPAYGQQPAANMQQQPMYGQQNQMMQRRRRFLSRQGAVGGGGMYDIGGLQGGMPSDDNSMGGFGYQQPPQHWQQRYSQPPSNFMPSALYAR